MVITIFGFYCLTKVYPATLFLKMVSMLCTICKLISAVLYFICPKNKTESQAFPPPKVGRPEPIITINNQITILTILEIIIILIILILIALNSNERNCSRLQFTRQNGQPALTYG